MTGILQILFASYAGADTITADFLVIAGGGGGQTLQRKLVQQQHKVTPMA
jgi:hypothetical protein